jgi:peptidoglycan/LPS O-acetylase OafA/YrhL
MSFQRFENGGRFENLDGLRALGIALVFLHHARLSVADTVIESNGRFGVSLFFVLSGFLIASLLLREVESNGEFAFGRFFVRRCLRIFPAFYAVLVVYLLLVYALNQFSPSNQALFTEKLPYLLTYTSNFAENASVGPLFVAWSLAVEEQFYLLIGLVVLSLNGRYLGVIALSMIALRIMSAIAGIQSALPIEEPLWIGVFAACVVRDPRIRQTLERWVTPRLLLVTGIFWLALLCTHEISAKHGVFAQLVYWVAAAWVTIAALSPAAKHLSIRPMRYVGQRSYSLYLTHMLALHVAHKVLSGWAAVALGLLLATALAELLYRLIELPSLSFRRRLTDTNSGVHAVLGRDPRVSVVSG